MTDILRRNEVHMKKYISASYTNGLVGIWWVYEDIIIGKCVPLDDGVDDHGFIQYSDTKNHMTEWKDTVLNQLPESAHSIISNGFRCIERGRVVYNIRAQVYEIICSDAVAADANLISKIAEEFEISDKRYDVITDPHYRIFQITGNPALDSFDY